MAKHYCRQGKKVVVVEPNEMLAEQTGEKLALVDFGITVTSIGRFYLEGPWHEVVILDEYDCILEGSSHLALPSGVRGLWQLRDKQVLAFSATSSLSHERLFGSCIGRPKVLAFKSEFEMLHGANPIAEACVVVCQDALKLQQQLQADLEKVGIRARIDYFEELALADANALLALRQPDLSAADQLDAAERVLAAERSDATPPAVAGGVVAAIGGQAERALDRVERLGGERDRGLAHVTTLPPRARVPW